MRSYEIEWTVCSSLSKYFPEVEIDSEFLSIEPAHLVKSSLKEMIDQFESNKKGILTCLKLFFFCIFSLELFSSQSKTEEESNKET